MKEFEICDTTVVQQMSMKPIVKVTTVPKDGMLMPLKNRTVLQQAGLPSCHK